MRSLTPLVILALSGTPALAAESPLAAADRLNRDMGGRVAFRYSLATGAARFVRSTNDATIPVGTAATTLPDKAYDFFDRYGALFGVAAARQELAVSTVVSDEAGSTVRMLQRYGFLPVFGAELIVHFDPAGAITAVNGTFVPAVKVGAQPSIGATVAAGQALAAVATVAQVNVDVLRASPPALGAMMAGLAQDTSSGQILAWKTTVSGPAIRKLVYVDARRGGTVEMFEGITDGLQRQNYNTLEQPDYSLAVRCRFEGDSPSNEPDCDNAFVFAGDTYNFYRNGFARDGFDDKGTPLRSYVHFFDPLICPNAFWNGQFMTYCSTFPHDDVAGHEISHGVTEFSANLVYAYQPGALNESFSDIFGETIDLLNGGENEPGTRWKIGEGIAPFVGLRDMADPTSPAYGNPDASTSDLYFCGASDQGGVHTNSGVPNKAYTLMVDGGSLNGVTVTGIGLTRSAAIQYRALTRYLGTYSNFADDNEALLASCRDLRSKKLHDPDPETGGGVVPDRISKADCQQVANALSAVRMTAPVCQQVAPQPAPAKCSTGTAVRLFFDDHESGSPGWSQSLDSALYSGQHWSVATDFAASGTHAWRANDELTSCSGGDFTSDLYLVSPALSLAGSPRPTLRFLHDFFTEGGYDGGTVEINVNGSWAKLEGSDFTLNPYNASMSLDSTAPNWTVASRSVFTGYRHPGDFPDLRYYESRVDLSPYVAQDADKVVQLRFRFATDFCNGSNIGWYLDDVEVYDCR